MKGEELDTVELLHPILSGGRRVRRGETLAMIAQRTGHSSETIRTAALNDQLFGSRTSPAILLPGDSLTIPPVRAKELGAGTGSKHTFRRRVGAQPTLRLVFTLNGAPRAGAAYTLDQGTGPKLKGTTDANGLLEEHLHMNTTRCLVRFEDDKEAFEVQIGELDPLRSLRGISQRLANLGFGVQTRQTGSTVSDPLRSAIRAFREHLAANPKPSQNPGEFRGGIDQGLLDQLEQQHGC